MLLKLAVMFVCTLIYAVTQEWINPYHGLVAGIPFAIWFVIEYKSEQSRKKRFDEEGEEDNRGMMSLLIGALLKTAIGIMIMWVSTIAFDNFTDARAIFFDTDRTALMQEIGIRKQDGNWAKVEEIISARLEKSTISKTFRRELAEIGHKAIITQGDTIPDEEWQRKQLVYIRAKEWAMKYGLETDLAETKLASVKLPTATPFPTRTPTLTPFPTRTPTATPTRILKPGESNPCKPPIGISLRETILLTTKKSGLSAELSPAANGIFERGRVTIQITGKEVAICVAGGNKPTDPLPFDDQGTLTVKLKGQIIATYPISGFDRTTGGIGPTPSQEIKWMFPEEGTYDLEFDGVDLKGPAYGTPDVNVFIYQ